MVEAAKAKRVSGEKGTRARVQIRALTLKS